MDQGVPQIALRDGNLMPQLGFGTWQIAAADCPPVLADAIKAGYRAYDTAQGYGNEGALGAAIRQSDLGRDAFFITSKLRNSAHSRDAALRSFDETMKTLGIEQIDLFLIHWPVPAEGKYVEAWKTLIELQQQGHVRSIGVSNFDRDHIERIITETGVTPAVNQIELHPLFQQRDFRGYHTRRNIRISSWSPLGPGTSSSFWWHSHGHTTDGNALEHPAVGALAKKHGKTAAQVIIRWHLQEGLLLNPRSVRRDRMAENIGVFDFTLDAEDMYRIEALDRPDDGRIGASPKEWTLMF
jgi:2,5-diketo-D-gluconate reductase A